MDAIFVDQAGHKKNFLYQYDKGQSFVVEDFEYSQVPKVQFSIKSIRTAPSVGTKLKDGILTVDIPDTLLTYGEDIIAYLYIEDALKGNVIETIFIAVIPRKRPFDYIYTSEMFARTINGTTISEDFGVGDVIEWADGNPNNERRSGYFVTINYGKNGISVSKATSIDNVYGVSVEDIGFASNCDEDKLNNYGYLFPQYAYVCSYGFATVKDNGVCIVGGMCVPGSDGTAVLPTNTVGYPVIGRVDDSHIFIYVDPSMRTINNFQTNIDENASSLEGHINDKSNPHTVTKSQVGLGNVPNVTTNDQTPTYTEATTLEKLTSGEKLSIAFGKISKAITDLISHIADRNNPHSVTKSQVGLGNVDNTSDVDKPISTATQTALDKKADLDSNGLVPLTQLPAQVKEIRVVDTIADRDAIAEKFANLRVYVKDATADSTVNSGGADYLYDGTTWIKTGEDESLDLVLSWDNVTDKPISFSPDVHASTHASDGSDPIAPVDIGAADRVHTHTVDEIGLLVDNKIPKDLLPEDSFDNVVVETITDRDALTPFEGLLVHVKDASGDTSVSTTYADYMYDGANWVIISGASSGGGGDVTQEEFDALVARIDNLAISTEFVMTDATTGDQYTLGMDNGKLIVIPKGETITKVSDGDATQY